VTKSLGDEDFPWVGVHGGEIVKGRDFVVEGLNSDVDYSFRIIAHNEIGSSEPSPASDSVRCSKSFVY